MQGAQRNAELRQGVVVVEICDRHGLAEPREGLHLVTFDSVQEIHLCGECYEMLFTLLTDPSTMLVADSVGEEKSTNRKTVN